MSGKIEQIFNLLFYYSWVAMLAGFVGMHVHFCADWWYDEWTAVAITGGYVAVCALLFMAIMYTHFYFQECAANNTYARKACYEIAGVLQAEYRALATYHERCKYLHFDMYKKGASDVFISLYLVTKKDERYVRIKYMVMWFFVREQNYKTPTDFKKAIFATIYDAFLGIETNPVLARSDFKKERSLATFLQQYKDVPLIETLHDDALFEE